MAMRLSYLLLSLVGAAHGFHAVPVASAHRLHRPAAASYAVRSADAPTMGLMDSLKNFFRGEEPLGDKKCATSASSHAAARAALRYGTRAYARESHPTATGPTLCTPPPSPPPPPPPPPSTAPFPQPRMGFMFGGFW